jgi:hypothetical protein
MKKIIEVDLKLFEYCQNNSGGRFVRPAITIFVEAESCDEANYIFKKVLDLEFNEGRECCECCECCGPRWRENINTTDEGDGYYSEEILKSIEKNLAYEKIIPQRAFIPYRTNDLIIIVSDRLVEENKHWHQYLVDNYGW